ncbi:MAG: hypothetical protein JSV52_02435 [Candidatus Zixiibacteriota bacterium]|nr:MAG: hypothetical protein JSV52_02435 [candidate division Zixibacteria bacterium]
MITLIGIVVIVLGLMCWIGQGLAVFAFPMAVKFGLFEPEEELDQSLYLFERLAQGIMDVLLAWILPLSALLMILDNAFWPLFALVGGGIYLYFPGLFMISRIVLKKHGKKVGSPSSVRTAYIFGTVWIVAAITMIVLATIELRFGTIG